jgi:hypothetical protein
MAATLQSQSIGVVNSVVVSARQLMGFYDQFVQLQQQWNDNSVAQIIEAMETVALNSDGSIGAADPSPDNDHPIDPAKYPDFTRALSANQIIQIKGIVDGFVAYIDGQAVPATPSARQLLNLTVGG